MAYQRRGPGGDAGRMCPFKRGPNMCTYYARYRIARDSGDGQLVGDGIACGAHVAEAIRDVWKVHKTAAIVQEIPGMWRS